MSINKSNYFSTNKDSDIINKIYSKLPNTLEELIGEQLYKELCNTIITKLNNKNDGSDYFVSYWSNNFSDASCEEAAKNISNLISEDSEKLERLITLKNDYICDLQDMIGFRMSMIGKCKKQIKAEMPKEVINYLIENNFKEYLILQLSKALDFSKYKFDRDTLLDEVLSMLLVDLVGHNIFKLDKLDNNLWADIKGEVKDEDSPFTECSVKIMVDNESILSIRFSNDGDELLDCTLDYFPNIKAVREACKIISSHTVAGEDRGRIAFQKF